jgi:hypothetical protein
VFDYTIGNEDGKVCLDFYSKKQTFERYTTNEMSCDTVLVGDQHKM